MQISEVWFFHVIQMTFVECEKIDSFENSVFASFVDNNISGAKETFLIVMTEIREFFADHLFVLSKHLWCTQQPIHMHDKYD